jgi:hypothetical protein
MATNRPGHYNRALEEAIQTHKAQWAKDWDSKNPLAGGATFSSMGPAERVGHLPPNRDSRYDEANMLDS